MNTIKKIYQSENMKGSGAAKILPATFSLADHEFIWT